MIHTTHNTINDALTNVCTQGTVIVYDGLKWSMGKEIDVCDFTLSISGSEDEKGHLIELFCYGIKRAMAMHIIRRCPNSFHFGQWMTRMRMVRPHSIWREKWGMPRIVAWCSSWSLNPRSSEG